MLLLEHNKNGFSHTQRIQFAILDKNAYLSSFINTIVKRKYIHIKRVRATRYYREVRINKFFSEINRQITSHLKVTENDEKIRRKIVFASFVLLSNVIWCIRLYTDFADFCKFIRNDWFLANYLKMILYQFTLTFYIMYHVFIIISRICIINHVICP